MKKSADLTAFLCMKQLYTHIFKNAYLNNI